MRRYIFVGPTLHRGLAMKQQFLLDDFVVLPPAKRGDMQRLLGTSAPSTAVIVDGYFHLHTLAIGHAELRTALEQGWTIWGLSSMGAIRAAEMRPHGMRGFGQVYERYATDPRFRDDEVALLHQPEPPYQSFSEPLVHLRALFDAMVHSGVLAPDRRDELIATLMPMWFGDRTLEYVTGRLAEITGIEIARQWVGNIDSYQLKSNDLAGFLKFVADGNVSSGPIV